MAKTLPEERLYNLTQPPISRRVGFVCRECGAAVVDPWIDAENRVYCDHCAIEKCKPRVGEVHAEVQ